MSTSQCSVLLYYQFTTIADPEAFRAEHHRKCLELGLKGRVLIASEGLNGTVAGTVEATEAYKRYVESLPGFESIQWKEDRCEDVPFAKLKVKLRKSLVSLGDADGVSVHQYKGNYLESSQWREALESGEDFLLLDVRNNYESEVGRFKGAHAPNLENFHDFPKWVSDLAQHKDKKILMYCTGGIRCEKFSALLVKEGFSDVHQLKGGILTYAKQEGGKHFEGKCFVFDDRLTVPVNEEAQPVAHCHYCGKLEDRMLNCADMECNRLIVCCDSCAEREQGACSAPCKASAKLRPFDSKTFRIPFRKKGVVFPELGRANKK